MFLRSNKKFFLIDFITLKKKKTENIQSILCLKKKNVDGRAYFF